MSYVILSSVEHRVLVLLPDTNYDYYRLFTPLLAVYYRWIVGVSVDLRNFISADAELGKKINFPPACVL